jgi:hypothetical protein
MRVRLLQRIDLFSKGNYDWSALPDGRLMRLTMLTRDI